MSTVYQKHPRTYHLPWSEGISSDDKVLTSVQQFEGLDVVVTEKRDGECTSLYPDGIVHARSIDGNRHPWQDAIKSTWRSICHELPEGWRIVGENLYARHSIHYESLTDWFELFAIFNEDNEVLGWNETVDWACLLGLATVPMLWDGRWDQQQIINLGKTLNTQTQEGYVVRIKDRFSGKDWFRAVGKWVRKNHVQTDIHWTQLWVPNKLM